MIENKFYPKVIKVALIHNIIAPYRIPLFEELARNPNIELFVYFTSESEKNREWIVNHNFSFNYKILPKVTLNLGKETFYHINPTIIRELYNGKFDVIISAGYSSFTNQIAFFVAKSLNIPFILWSGSTENEHSLLRIISLPFVKYVVKRSDLFIAYGTNAKKYLVKLGASEEKVFISFNSVDTNFFKNAILDLKLNKNDLKEKFGLNYKFVVLYVGQLIERKGIKYLLEAHKKLNRIYDVGLVIVGNGNEKSELIEWTKINNINNVHIFDFVQKDALPCFYAVADIFVLPSSEEVWGLVLNEAMACGLPVISTNAVGASVDLIKNEINGFIVEPKNEIQLYDSINKIFMDPALMNNMGIFSENIIRDITVENSSKAFSDAINSLMNGFH